MNFGLRPKTHPLTGAPIVPLGFRPDGRAIWPILGGSEDAGKTDPDGGAGTGQGEGDKPEPKDSETTPPAGDPQKKIAALEEEKNRHYSARTTAEQERDDLQKRLKAIEDKDKDELTKAQERIAELETGSSSSAEALKQLSLQNAFLKDNTYSWFDPDDALQLADLSKVEIDKEGKVSGLKEALETLVKAKPHLVKPKDGDDQGKTPPPKTGDPAHGSRNKKDELDREALQKKYPALRR